MASHLNSGQWTAHVTPSVSLSLSLSVSCSLAPLIYHLQNNYASSEAARCIGGKRGPLECRTIKMHYENIMLGCGHSTLGRQSSKDVKGQGGTGRSAGYSWSVWTRDNAHWRFHGRVTLFSALFVYQLGWFTPHSVISWPVWPTTRITLAPNCVYVGVRSVARSFAIEWRDKLRN